MAPAPTRPSSAGPESGSARPWWPPAPSHRHTQPAPQGTDTHHTRPGVTPHLCCVHARNCPLRDRVWNALHRTATVCSLLGSHRGTRPTPMAATPLSAPRDGPGWPLCPPSTGPWLGHGQAPSVPTRGGWEPLCLPTPAHACRALGGRTPRACGQSPPFRTTSWGNPVPGPGPRTWGSGIPQVPSEGSPRRGQPHRDTPCTHPAWSSSGKTTRASGPARLPRTRLAPGGSRALRLQPSEGLSTGSGRRSLTAAEAAVTARAPPSAFHLLMSLTATTPTREHQNPAPQMGKPRRREVGRLAGGHTAVAMVILRVGQGGKGQRNGQPAGSRQAWRAVTKGSQSRKAFTGHF